MLNKSEADALRNAITPTLYVVTFSSRPGMGDLRRHTGTYEMDMDRMTLANIAQDVLDGQFPDVRRVYEATPGQDCAEVTEDVATLVACMARREHVAITHGLKTWLHEVLGVESTAGMVDA